jgi:hypothetical protein
MPRHSQQDCFVFQEQQAADDNAIMAQKVAEARIPTDGGTLFLPSSQSKTSSNKTIT